MQIDHLAYAAPDLSTAVADVEERFGVRAHAGGKHLGYGVHNALLALGPRTYLEIVAPDPEQPKPAKPRPFGVDDISRGKLVGWAIARDDIDAAAAEARGRGYDPGDVIRMQRTRPSGAMARFGVTLNAMPGGPVPFLIDWGDSEHPASSAPGGIVLESFHLEHPDPASIAPQLNALGADVQIKKATACALVAHLSGPNGSAVLC